MLDGIRKRLTLLYTGLTALFLICFMVASYLGLNLVFYLEGKQEILSFAAEEAREHATILKNPWLLEMDIELMPEFGGRVFFYVYDNNGKLVSALEPNTELRSAVKAVISDWKLPQGSVEQQIVNVSNGKRIIMMASQGIYEAGRLLGVVYVGRDETDFYGILNIYALVIALIGLGFLILVYIVGNIMAGKAMGPINKSLERQRQFTADASHELRTPLTVLLSSTEAVLDDKESNLSPFASQIVTDMKDEIRKINKLVADLLTLARVDAEAQKIYYESFDMVPVIKEAVRSLRTLAGQKNIRLSVKIPDKLIIFADKMRLYQLVYILVDNAIKYTLENGAIELTASLSGDRVFNLSVKDSGIGIAPEDQKHIFDRFYRVDKARSREQGGTGLGLSIAKWIVDAHSGSISVNSMLGQGTTFHVTINSTQERLN